MLYSAILSAHSVSLGGAPVYTWYIASLTRKGKLLKKSQVKQILSQWTLDNRIPNVALRYMRSNCKTVWPTVPFIRNAILRLDDEQIEPEFEEVAQFCEENGIDVDLVLPRSNDACWNDMSVYALTNNISADLSAPSESLDKAAQKRLEDILGRDTVQFLFSSNREHVNLSFVRILQHWFVACRIPHYHITKLLRMLKKHKPEIIHGELPTTAQTFLKLNKKDKEGVQKINVTNPTDPTNVIGTYMHYGVEDAVLCKSAGESHCPTTFYSVFKFFTI
jgi:hypothetical protein